MLYKLGKENGFNRILDAGHNLFLPNGIIERLESD
jgi:hypothetical protein